MKTQKIILLLIFFSLSLFLFQSCSKKEQWVAKVEGEKISLDDFNFRFDMYLKNAYADAPDLIPLKKNSMEEREAFLKELVNEILLLKEAKKMGIPKQEDVKRLIRLTKQQIIIQAYVSQLNLLNDIRVSEEDVDKYYKENKEYFKGRDPEYVRMYIYRRLVLAQQKQKLDNIVDKLKNKYRIQVNEDAIRPIMSESNILNNQQRLDMKNKQEKKVEKTIQTK